MKDTDNIKEELANLEVKLEAQIPQDYKDFLLNLETDFLNYPLYKGWENIKEYKIEYLLREKPIPAYYTFYSSDPDSKWPVVKIINLYSLIEQNPYGLSTAYDNFQSNVHENYENYLPIADNGCGDEVCICLKGENKEKIFICAHEQNYELILLSKSLKEFLSKMKKE